MFDLSITKVLVLAVIALVVFGPKQLPKMAAQAGQALRELRRMAEGAKSELQEGLGPEFRDFDLNDLNPRTFVRKHLWEPLEDGNGDGNGDGGMATVEFRGTAALPSGEPPPYDTEAT